MNSLRFAVTLIALLVPTGAAYAGPVTYIYTGNDFTDAEYPLQATDSIDISMTLAAPLSDNLVDQSVTPLSFTFSDGYSVDDASKPVNWFFNFNTDGLGNITGWEVAADFADGDLGGTVNGIKEGNETLPIELAERLGRQVLKSSH